MNYQKRPPLTSREIQLLLLIAVVTVVVLAVFIGTDIRLSQALPGGGGFWSAWEGARAFLFRHADPYGGAIAASAQQDTYGRPALPGENPYFLAIPFFLLPFYFPFALLSDPAAARGLWLFLNEAALVGTAVLTLRLIEWQPGRMFQGAYGLLSVFGFYSVAALIEGGPAIFLGLLYLAILIAYSNEQDEFAGALLVLAMFAWQLGAPFVLLVVWKTIQEQRWRTLAGFGMTFLVLMALSLLLYPGWILPFVVATLASMRASFGMSAPAALIRLFPAYGEHAAQAATILLIILLLYEWAATRGADKRRFIWAACLTLAVTPLLGFRTEVGNLVVLFPGLALVFAATTSRWRGGNWVASLLFLVALLVPWAFFVRWYILREARAYDYLFLFAPLYTLAGLYWTRWWFLRPSRTWFEHVRSTLGRVRRSSSRGSSRSSDGNR